MVKVKTHAEESIGANPAEAAINPTDSVAMGVPSARAPRWLRQSSQIFSALRHREYRLLFAAFLINQTGFWVSHLSLQGLMVRLSNNDPMMLGTVFFVLFLPAFLLAPLAGVAADRFDRKRIVVMCYAAVAILTGTLAVLTGSGAITTAQVLVIAAGMGTAFAFSGPANMAVAANSVPEEDLPSAVALQSALNNLTRVFGPALATPFIVAGRFEISFGVYMVAAVIAGSLIALMRLSPYEPEDDDSGIFSRIASGFDHARERAPALPALVTVAALSLFGVSHTALISVYAESVLGDMSYFTAIAIAQGAGALFGALVQGTQTPSLRIAAMQMVVYGALLMGFAQTDVGWLALGFQVLIGYFYFSVMTALQTLVQQLVDEAKRGRVMSLFQVAWAGLVPFGSLGMGVAANWTGVVTTLTAAGAICTAYGLAMTLLARGYAVVHLDDLEEAA